MPLMLLAGVAILWMLWPTLRKMRKETPRAFWIVVIGGGLALLFLLKGKAVLSAVAAVAALAAKVAYSPLGRPLMTAFVASLPGIAGRRARKKRQQTKQQKQLKDAAATLAVSVDADTAEIHRAYVAYMKTHHPDKGGSEAAAQQGAHARDVLLAQRESEKNTHV